MAEDPDALEAGYSRSQIENIVKAVVPPGLRLQAGVDLALAQLDRADAEQEWSENRYETAGARTMGRLAPAIGSGRSLRR